MKNTYTKILLIAMVLSLLLAVIGCETSNPSTGEDKPAESGDNLSGQVNAPEDDSLQEEDTAKNDGPRITVDQLPYEITILEPDSIGTRYMEATFTNNSEYPVTGYTLTILLKDKEEKTYLSTYDTVLPGETSPKFETFAPESGKEEDLEILKVEIVGADGDEDFWIDYDVKLDKYDLTN